MSDRSVYEYDGPVCTHGVCIMDNWKAETTATGRNSALRNLKYQFNKEYGRGATAAVELMDSKLKIVC